MHGGVDKAQSSTPLNRLYVVDIAGMGSCQDLTTTDSPALSHHAGVVLHDRYILLIGGWNGHVRTSQVFVYDTEENHWMAPQTSGFAAGAGLSSHTASLLDDSSVLIIGREGSTRIQKRFGNAYLLRGSIAKNSFIYHEHALGLASRSGHTAHVLGGSLYILGGRADKVLEVHGGFRSTQTSCSMMEIYSSKVKTLNTPSMPKPPTGRKLHISVAGSDVILMHGGETFDGRREPVGEMFLLSLKPHIHWIKLGVADVRRQGHIASICDDKVVIQGGIGLKGSLHGELFELQVS